ncbi:cob(I)yrinic acid a,c-diamide adenosyltransferas e [Desulfonema ishimotonii]|uniref:corrinoid adenosyltransferase n=1 Tax=Desulfonema ishimotonii TaxID=45657 RepID=A0A401FXQ5_9BACT|nr:cob(I)yrinic acid a,c-diamide adenosyltransferase [Desulfonema ishimotonii]GBC61729.1 cob(I)yrinic acid a,c-diamide adenosyltransferas e [Desulfonema ishimotonii]
MKKSLLMINTGDGKGKTTAALGLAFRAIGHGQNVCVIQFIKGSWKYGEIETAAKLNGHLEFHVMGRGFTWKSDNLEEDAALARNAWEMAKEKIASGKYRLVVLDEMTYLFLYGMLDEAEVIEFLKNRPEGVHVMITGRNASKNLMAAADMVTQMEPVKHHYENGIKAQKGIEF